MNNSQLWNCTYTLNKIRDWVDVGLYFEDDVLRVDIINNINNNESFCLSSIGRKDGTLSGLKPKAPYVSTGS